jgi:hypothetical protein
LLQTSIWFLLLFFFFFFFSQPFRKGD